MVMTGLMVATPSAEAHRITNAACARQALAAARLIPPATLAEFRARYAACRAWGARHNAAHLTLCQQTRSPYYALKCVFPSSVVPSMWRVMRCESTAHDETPYPDHGIYASNGQYAGLAQLGTSERSSYGWYDIGDPPYQQVKTTYRLWRARGFGPWKGYGCY